MPTGASLSPWSECTKCSAVVRVQSIIIGEEHVEPVMVPGCCRNIIARDIASPFSFSHFRRRPGEIALRVIDATRVHADLCVRRVSLRRGQRYSNVERKSDENSAILNGHGLRSLEEEEEEEEERVKRQCANSIRYAPCNRRATNHRFRARDPTACTLARSDNSISVREWTRRFSHRSHSLNSAKVSRDG